MMKKTGLVFALFLIWLPKISAESCCNTFKVELERKWQAYQTLCQDECKGYALHFKGNTSDYAVIKDDRVSAIAAITVCLWVKTNQTTSGHFISYAIKKDDNHFIMQLGSSNLAFTIVANGPSNRKMNVLSDGKWHHVCVTWKSQGGLYEMYKDGKPAGTGSVIGSSGRKISPGGLWVLGQDQDSLGGGFEAKQAYQGEMTEVNIWDKVLSAQDILEISKTCKSIRKGNVKSWNEFKSGVKGNVKIVKPTCCSIINI